MTEHEWVETPIPGLDPHNDQQVAYTRTTPAGNTIWTDNGWTLATLQQDGYNPTRRPVLRRRIHDTAARTPGASITPDWSIQWETRDGTAEDYARLLDSIRQTVLDYWQGRDISLFADYLNRHPDIGCHDTTVTSLDTTRQTMTTVSADGTRWEFMLILGGVLKIRCEEHMVYHSRHVDELQAVMPAIANILWETGGKAPVTGSRLTVATRDGEWIRIPVEEGEWDAYSRRILTPLCGEICSLLDRWARPRGEAQPIIRLLDQRHDMPPERLLTRVSAVTASLFKEHRMPGASANSALRVDLEDRFVEI